VAAHQDAGPTGPAQIDNMLTSGVYSKERVFAEFCAVYKTTEKRKSKVLCLTRCLQFIT